VIRFHIASFLTSSRKHTGIADKEGRLFAYRISPPRGSEEMQQKSQSAIESLASAYTADADTFSHKRGNFETATFGISFGGGQKVCLQGFLA